MYLIFFSDVCACVYAAPSSLTKSLRWHPHVGIHSVDVDQTVFLVVDPHFVVIDDAGYHTVCTGSTAACQTHNHDAMLVHATRQGANFCN